MFDKIASENGMNKVLWQLIKIPYFFKNPFQLFHHF